MNPRKPFNSTLIRFAMAGMIVLGALAFISARLIPREETPPIIVTHPAFNGTVEAYDNSQPDPDRRPLDALMSDQEISHLSAAAVAAVSPAVVVVHRGGEDGVPDVIGSGVAISESGYILASLGTTGEAGEVQITWPNGVTSDARIVRIDQTYQIALLQTSAKPEAIASIAAYPTRSGDRILAIGSPLEDFTSTVTGGVVGAIGIELPAGDDRPAVPHLIQHDAAINDGNEGGPIVDLNGNVVGINIGSIVQQDDELIQGWSFAVPVSVLAPLLADLE